jgi:heptosyltransferase II
MSRSEARAAPVKNILIIKTGALGDVLRTSSILAGLRSEYPVGRIEWVTAPAAADLVRSQAEVDGLHLLEPGDDGALEALGDELERTSWDWVISLDDERPLCALATRLGRARLSGACLDQEGQRAYTADVGPWFDMGLLSVHGKQEADRLKIENRCSHPKIYAEMLGIPMGRTELPLEEALLARAAARVGRQKNGLLIGLNTGAGGRWTSKQLPVERVVALVSALRDSLGEMTGFVILGGRDEASRNRAIIDGLSLQAPPIAVIDPGVENSLLEFAAIINSLDLLITSDSLALHLGVARRVPIVAFFAPTSAAEIELYGLGEKVCSTSTDYCSYSPAADNSSITAERLAEAAARVLSMRQTT